MIKKTNHIIIILFTFVIPANTQITDDLATLENYLLSHHDKLLSSRIKPHETSKKYNYLNFIPSVGYAYGGAYISFNVYQVAQFFRSNHQANNQIKGLHLQSEISIQSDLTSLKSKYKHCQMLFSRLYDLIEIYELEKKIFYIKEEEYNNGQIPIEDYLKEKISIKKNRQPLDNLKDRIILNIIDLEGITNQEINYIMPDY